MNRVNALPDAAGLVEPLPQVDHSGDLRDDEYPILPAMLSLPRLVV
jgi:hypothetical protein